MEFLEGRRRNRFPGERRGANEPLFEDSPRRIENSTGRTRKGNTVVVIKLSGQVSRWNLYTYTVLEKKKKKKNVER